MNKEDAMKMYYLRIEICICDCCYERIKEWKDKRNYELKEDNLIMEGNLVTGVCYEKMKWKLEEINQVREVHKTEHKTGA